MKSALLSLLVSTVSFAHGATISRPSSDGLLVRTKNGLVQGFINDTAPHVRQFLGIPYAQPPVGDLRWLAPKPVISSYGTLNATAFAPSCMQQFSATKTIYTEVVPQFLIAGGQSEDCLYLNVWAPVAKKSKKLPVFVYIPGGGFTSGGAHSLYKIPDKWIERTQTHIVVIMNYRVNLFGFPNAIGLTDQNVGILDQRMVVEWVRDNVAAFGGDPDRIILWGQSAGGFSADNYGYAFYKDPIIKGIIADSGDAAVSFGANADVAQSNFTFLASLVNCTQTDATARLTCMRKVPAVTLENASSNYMISGVLPKIAFTPINDNVTAFSNTTDRAIRGLIANIPLITGSNTNEGAGFVAYSPDGPGATLLHALTQAIIACPVAQEVRNRNLIKLPVYRYQYAGNFSNISPVSWMGAYHSSELPLLFGTHYEYRGDSPPFEYKVSHLMEALWLSFAQNPSAPPCAPSGFEWPLFTSERDTMALFAEGKKAVQLVSGSVIDGGCTLAG